MLWLKEHTARIERLVDEGTAESLTSAALQCRLAIEMVCYERLRNAHDYISADDLRRWQPSYVINQLIEEVDPHVASSFTMSVSKSPSKSGGPAPTQAEYEAEEFVEIGRQVGFDAKKLGKLWNGLGNFLHVRMPRSRDDDIQFFGDPSDVRRKVAEALVTLRELEAGTLISSGLGERVSFPCACGTSNARRAGLLKEGQVVNCLNPDCDERWTVQIEDGEHEFHRRQMAVTCTGCGMEGFFPEKQLHALPRNEVMRFDCSECGVSNFVMWKLMHLKRAEQPNDDPPTESFAA